MNAKKTKNQMKYHVGSNEKEGSASAKWFGIIALASMLAILFLAPCQTQPQGNGNGPSGGTGTSSSGSEASASGQAATQQLKEFNNVNELEQFLASHSISASGSGTSGSLGTVTTSFSPSTQLKAAAVASPELATANGVAPAADTSAVSGSESSGSGSAIDYSSTNVQVAGVDEPDYVKNDGQYIYMIADNKLIIVNAYDAPNASIISTTRINVPQADNGSDYYSQSTGREILINGDKLVLFVESNERAFYFQPYDITPYPTYKPVTYARVYDISDKESPKLLDSFKLPGSYYQARMIGNYVYAISQQSVFNNVYINEPLVTRTDSSGNVKTVTPKIYYFDNPEQNYQFNTITSINLGDDSISDSKSFMLGYANTLMVSENNIYIAYQKQQYWPRPLFMPVYDGYGEYDKARFYNVTLPLLPAELKSDIDGIMGKGLGEEEQWKQITDRLSSFDMEMDSNDTMRQKYQDTFQKIGDALEEYDTKKALENSMTIIQKIAIDSGSISYVAKGEVYGTLLNKYSLDEYNGYLRVATTVNIWTGKRTTYNDVFVLDGQMKQVGKLENVAEGERIYSTRFLGDKLYMVTFKQVDPLFVIDLSSPSSPKILGYLKMTGYSDYLHPYDATHIIGIGKETEQNDYGGITTKGLKIALFDVSDFSNPRIVDSVVIGDMGTDSPALHDPHAFLFSRSKNLLVLPVTEVTNRHKVSQYIYSNTIWHGAYVFNVTADGISQIGKVQHSSTTSDYFNWWDQASVMRSLYMDNYLYTISNRYIKINDLSNGLEPVKTINLPYQDNNYPVPVVQMAAVK